MKIKEKLSLSVIQYSVQFIQLVLENGFFYRMYKEILLNMLLPMIIRIMHVS